MNMFIDPILHSTNQRCASKMCDCFYQLSVPNHLHSTWVDGISLIKTGQVMQYFLYAPGFSAMHLVKQLFVDTLQARKEIFRRFNGLIYSHL